LIASASDIGHRGHKSHRNGLTSDKVVKKNLGSSDWEGGSKRKEEILGREETKDWRYHLRSERKGLG